MLHDNEQHILHQPLNPGSRFLVVVCHAVCKAAVGNLQQLTCQLVSDGAVQVVGFR